MKFYTFCTYVYFNITLRSRVAVILQHFEHGDQDPYYEMVLRSEFTVEGWSPHHLARPVSCAFSSSRRNIWLCVSALPTLLRMLSSVGARDTMGITLHCKSCLHHTEASSCLSLLTNIYSWLPQT